MRIGILGGTFNPIHHGHLILAQEALERLHLDKVIFMPTHIPPHKGINSNVSPRQRYHMVSLAVRGNPHFTVSRLELDRQGKSYTIDTLTQMQKKIARKAKMFFLAGSDALPDLSSWKGKERLLRLVDFIVIRRPNYPVRNLPSRIRLLRIAPIDISSSDIRSRIRRGLSVRYLVPEAVWRYIDKNKLYQ